MRTDNVFLLAASRVFTGTEAARCQPEGEWAPALDSFTRLLQRQPAPTGPMGDEVKGQVQPCEGVLVLDGATLDKP